MKLIYDTQAATLHPWPRIDDAEIVGLAPHLLPLTVIDETRPTSVRPRPSSLPRSPPSPPPPTKPRSNASTATRWLWLKVGLKRTLALKPVSFMLDF